MRNEINANPTYSQSFNISPNSTHDSYAIRKNKKKRTPYFISYLTSDIHKSKTLSASEQTEQGPKPINRRKSNRRLCVFCRGRNERWLACLLATIIMAITTTPRMETTTTARNTTRNGAAGRIESVCRGLSGLRGSGPATNDGFF